MARQRVQGGWSRARAGLLALAVVTLGAAPRARAAQAPAPARNQPCRVETVPGVVWHGTETKLTLAQLAAYTAPVYWFSPDEPKLRASDAGPLVLPQPLPFESAADRPVVYYQFAELAVRDGERGRASVQRHQDPAQTVVDLRHVGSFRLNYYAYFPTEQGVGAHDHDVEGAEFKAVVMSTDSEFFREHTGMRCSPAQYLVYVTRVSAKAHGLFWFWNVSDTNEETRLPMHLLVEEGKHALATDKNSDGHYTPGYDVSERLNDAWGVRDATRSGLLFSGGYEAWMSKVRRPEDRLFPPLPEDSPLRAGMLRRAGDGPRAEYQLRPLPAAERARATPGLFPFLEDKDVPDWPEVTEAGTGKEILEWVDAGQSLRSVSFAAYFDGRLGGSVVLPLLLVKNVEAPMAGGYLVHRLYLKDKGLRDFGWMLMYTPSASRWFDTYAAAGVERDREDGSAERPSRTDFVLETGVKFRVNISRSPVKFLAPLTPFWGVRFGVKNYGFSDIDRLTYVIEVGAGVW